MPLSVCESWMQGLAVKFVNVTFVTGEHVLKMEQHVDDPETLEFTIRQSMARMAWSYAIFPWMGRWVLMSKPGRLIGTRYYDSREAAEMVALHGG